MRRTLGDLTDEEYAAQRDLTTALRDLARAAGTTGADAATIADAVEVVNDLTDRLAVGGHQRVTRATFDEPALWARKGESVPMNHLNPAHPRFDMHFEGDFARAAETGDIVGLVATADLVVGALYEGPPHAVHGGTAAFLLDCITGVLVQSSGVAAVTGELTTRYVRRTPLDEPISMRAEVTGRRGRLITVEGTISHHGEVCVQGKALFVAIERPMAPPPDA